jgi:eukaryotic-like serine/threonine-protein kinase
MTGTTLSHYEILDEISRGGMGIVYRARDTRLNRDVALKVLPPELVADADRKRRFVQEAQAAASLSHPHIAVVYEIGESDGVTFVTMELIDGRKLSDVLEGRPLSMRRALELTSEIAEGLARAHEKNIVHRDIKPANIMVTSDGHAKIIDFGLAKLVEPLSHDAHGPTIADNTAPGVVLGTTPYMSPEQARRRFGRSPDRYLFPRRGGVRDDRWASAFPRADRD